MTTTHATNATPPEAMKSRTTDRWWTPRAISIGAAALLAAAGLFASIRQTAEAPAKPAIPATPTEQTLSARAELENLVNRGLVPRQALEPARTTEREMLEDLVNRGLVPRQALEPVADAEDEG